MDASFVWAVLLMTMLGGIVLLRRRRGAKLHAEPLRPPRDASPSYHCVSIRARGGACEQARSLGGVRFLAGEAPPIPLPGCGTATCGCAYQHFGDRRQEDRRTICANSIYVDAATHGERRASRSRRASDRSVLGRAGRAPRD